MRSVNFFTSFAMLIILSLNLQAQDSSRTRYGLGVNFAKDFIVASVGDDMSIMSLPYDFSNFLVIIRSEKFRFEPSLGYFRYSRSSSRTDYNSESSSSNWRLGAKVAINQSHGNMNYYYGISLGFIFTSTHSKYSSSFDSRESDESKTDFFVGPIVGGEYNLIEYLSLGGEIQFNYISFGQYGDDSVGSETERSESALTTRAIIVLRWYFK